MYVGIIDHQYIPVRRGRACPCPCISRRPCPCISRRPCPCISRRPCPCISQRPCTCFSHNICLYLFHHICYVLQRIFIAGNRKRVAPAVLKPHTSDDNGLSTTYSRLYHERIEAGFHINFRFGYQGVHNIIRVHRRRDSDSNLLQCRR